jgi:hypothetical protein
MKQRKYALIAGWSLIAMAITAGFSYGLAYSSILILGDPNETLVNLQSSSDIFIGGIAGWALIVVLDLIVTWSLYRYFAKTNLRLSMTTAIIRLVYTAVLAYSIHYLIKVLPLMEVQDAQATYELMISFESVWSLGLIVFGAHLFCLGLLALKANEIHKSFGWLLIFGGVSYTIVHSLKAILDPSVLWIIQLENVLSIPMAISELAFAIWLLIKRGRNK